jgi:hypothetical protein
VEVPTLERGYTVVRLAAGMGLLVAPGLGARLLGRPGERRLGLALGARDLVLAAGTALAPQASPARRSLLAVSAFSDACDAVLALTGRRTGSARVVTTAALLAASVGGAATGAYLAARSSSTNAATTA